MYVLFCSMFCLQQFSFELSCARWKFRRLLVPFPSPLPPSFFLHVFTSGPCGPHLNTYNSSLLNFSRFIVSLVIIPIPNPSDPSNPIPALRLTFLRHRLQSKFRPVITSDNSMYYMSDLKFQVVSNFLNAEFSAWAHPKLLGDVSFRWQKTLNYHLIQVLVWRGNFKFCHVRAWRFVPAVFFLRFSLQDPCQLLRVKDGFGSRGTQQRIGREGRAGYLWSDPCADHVWPWAPEVQAPDQSFTGNGNFAGHEVLPGEAEDFRLLNEKCLMLFPMFPFLESLGSVPFQCEGVTKTRNSIIQVNDDAKERGAVRERMDGWELLHRICWWQGARRIERLHKISFRKEPSGTDVAWQIQRFRLYIYVQIRYMTWFNLGSI